MAASWNWQGNIHLDSLVEKVRINSAENPRLCPASREGPRWQFARCWPAKCYLNKMRKLWRASEGRICIEWINALLKFMKSSGGIRRLEGISTDGLRT
jgi:hypothetical protein